VCLTGTLEPRTLVVAWRVIDWPSLIHGYGPVWEEIGGEGRGRTPGGLGMNRALLGHGTGTASDRHLRQEGNLLRNY